MSEAEIKHSFEHFMVCRAGFLMGELTRREENLSRCCFFDQCDFRKPPEVQARSAEILQDLAERVEGRVVAA